MRVGVIYKATNIRNSEGYIGQSIGVMKRITRHKYDTKNGKDTHFCRALRLYDWDAFEWEVLYFDIPQDQLSNMERWCIANYDTFHNGYNSTEGGDDNPMNNPENRKKVSESHKGRKRPPMSEETRKKLSNANLGENNPNYGKSASIETKDRLSKSHSRFEYKITKPDGKIDLTTKLSLYCRENNLGQRKMCYVAHGKRNHHKGFRCEKIREL